MVSYSSPSLEGSDRDGADATATSTKGRIVQLEMDNFKSYKGSAVIGPFKNFTAVIGPNGSGKSNLMDAISFVLGVKTAQLRGNLKELLYANSQSQSPADQPRRGHVALLYEPADGSPQVTFTRAITTSASDVCSSQYKLDGRTVTWDAYNLKLQSFGILVKARNFLVFQGDIESVASMSPEGLTSMFETISGSETCRTEYEDLEVKVAASETRSQYVHSKKRLVAGEKRAKKEQKEEAEEWARLQAELGRLRQQLFLWRLFHLDEDLAGVRSAAAGVEAELAGFRQAQEAHQRQLEAAGRAAGRAKKEKLLKQKAIARLRAARDGQNPEVERADAEVESLVGVVKRLQRELRAREQKLELHQARLRGLEAEAATVDAERAALETELAARRAAQSVQLSEAQMAEYELLRTSAGGVTCGLQQECAVLEVEQQAEQADLDRKAENVAQMTAKAASLSQEGETLRSQSASLREQIAAVGQEAAAQEAAAAAAVDEIRKCGASRNLLEQRVADLEVQLSDVRAERKETRRSRKQKEAVADFKQRFPGRVLGRLTDLGRAIAARYHLPLAVLMGRNMEAVVVDCQHTAQQCIQHMKAEKIPPMLFIPIKEVVVRPVAEGYRTLGGSSKLALDLMEFDRALEPAFRFALGNALVTDGIDEAKRLAYDGPERRKVVTVDGVLIAKNGNMTGGASASMSAKAAQFNDTAVTELSEELTASRSQLAALPTVRAVQASAASAAEAITALRERHTMLSRDLEAASTRIASVDKQVAALQAAAAGEGPPVAALRERVTARGERLAGLLSRIHTAADDTFQHFSAQVGVPNIRVYMEERRRLQQSEVHDRSKLDAKAAQIEQAAQYERGTDFREAVQQRRAALEEAERRQQAARERRDAAREAGVAAAAALEQEEGVLKELEASCEAAGVEVSRLKRAAAQHANSHGELRRRAEDSNSRAEALALERRSTLETAALQQVDLPEAPDGDAHMETETESQEERPRQLDYSELPAALKRSRGRQAREAHKQEVETSIAAAVEALSKLHPNQKAIEQFESIRLKERQLVEEADAAGAEAAQLRADFEAVRDKRHRLFMAAFTPVQQEIDRVYKELTLSAVHNQGGTAYLSLDNDEAPFLAGVKYSAMPPTKRFRDMEQLSGGEKTLAALALLFALHSAAPSPFFVLDEVDAALDATNVARVARYIRGRTRSGGEGSFQTIVISLKDVFYDKADGLVGVCKDAGANASTVLTFDLSRWGDGVDV